MSAPTALSSAFPAAATRLRAAGLLWRASGTVMALIPVAMAVAHRSSPLVLGLSAALALVALTVEGGWAELKRDLSATFRAPLGRAVLVFFGWSVLSLAWSEFPELSFAALLEFWTPVACAFLLALTIPSRVPRVSLWLYAGITTVACAMILLELRTGLALRREFGLRTHSFIFNRTVLTILVGFVPLLAGLWRAGRWGRVTGMGLAVVVLATASRSESGAAAFGALVAGLTALVAFAAPRLTLHVAAAAVCLVFTLAPVLGPIGHWLVPPSLHERLAESHSRDRIEIWTSFGAAIREQPWIGAGFGSSGRLAQSEVAGRVPPAERRLLGVGHPHNGAVQVWVELGLVGAILGAAVLLLVLRALRPLPRGQTAAALALMGGIAAVSLVGHGVWQGWWPAAVGAAVVWFRFVYRGEDAR